VPSSVTARAAHAVTYGACCRCLDVGPPAQEGRQGANGGDPFVRRLVVGEALVGLSQERVADFLQRGIGARDSQREVLT
jgi:hypothetical protein